MTLFGWLLRVGIIFTVLTVIYIIMTISGRLKHRRRLEKKFKEEGSELSKEDFMEAGMKKYNRSLKAKLVLGVYLIPIVIFSGMIYLARL